MQGGGDCFVYRAVVGWFCSRKQDGVCMLLRGSSLLHVFKRGQIGERRV